MTKRPLIGVTGSARGGLIMWWFNRLAVARSGGRAVRITPNRPFPIDQLDGLVIGGGDDIDAQLYGMVLEPSIRIDARRDAMEQRALEHAIGRGLPVLGICRGSQMLNVFLGGSLHIEIQEVYPGVPRLRTVLPRKTVHIEPNSRLARIMGMTECRVNALHHQSVDRLGNGVRVVVRDDFGIVQGIEVPDHPCLMGVQWHPEFLVFDRHQQALFGTLVDAARLRRAGEPCPA
jgi:putative glutamine amidotransferase